MDGGLDTYGYALQNPLMYTDPTGENTIVFGSAIVIGGAIIVCYASGACQNLSDLISSSFSMSNSSSLDECEMQCDLEWDRNKFMCDAAGAMHGFKSKAYKNCMDRADRIYVQCYQDCADECS